MAWQEITLGLWATVGVSTVRAVAGWLNNALEDGKIERFEIKKLLETVFRLTMSGVAIYFSIPLFGLDPNILASAAAAALLDILYKKG